MYRQLLHFIVYFILYLYICEVFPANASHEFITIAAMEQKFLRSIQEYVIANLHKVITLDDLAEVVCLSPSSLYKKMKEYADISPMEYVMKMRLHKAVELLKDDSVSVQEVASAVGFNTHSFFSECFKRIVFHTKVIYEFVCLIESVISSLSFVRHV